MHLREITGNVDQCYCRHWVWLTDGYGWPRQQVTRWVRQAGVVLVWPDRRRHRCPTRYTRPGRRRAPSALRPPTAAAATARSQWLTAGRATACWRTPASSRRPGDRSARRTRTRIHSVVLSTSSAAEPPRTWSDSTYTRVSLVCSTHGRSQSGYGVIRTPIHAKFFISDE